MTTLLLKLIAVISMTIDHIGYIMRFRMDTDLLRAIGRIAFPIYAFLISEGCANTRNIKKYLMRLGIFAIIAEAAFDFFDQNVPYYPSLGSPVFLNFYVQNIFFTLFFGALCIYWVMFNADLFKAEYTAENPATPVKLLTNVRLYSFVGFLALILTASYYMNVDYGLKGVLLIFSLYLSRSKKSLQLAVLAAFMFYIYIIDGNSLKFYGFGSTPLFSSLHPFYTKMFIGSLFTVPIIAMYNGKPGPRPAWLKWGFYAYYPVHLVILALINIILSM